MNGGLPRMDIGAALPHQSAMQPRPGTTETLARFVVDTRWEDIPERARHEAKRALLNFFAVALAGCRTEPVELALKSLSEFSGGRQATVIGRRERLDALSAAFLNAADLCRSRRPVFRKIRRDQYRVGRIDAGGCFYRCRRHVRAS